MEVEPGRSESFDQSRESVHGEDDRISELPHEICVSILSFLPIIDAARTSVLSRRWKHMWRYFTGNLDLSTLDSTIWKIVREMKSVKVERFHFIGYVNCILEVLQCSSLDSFRVRFDMNERSKRYIDSWVEFAMAKRVQRLELDFTPFFYAKKLYSFPKLRGIEFLKSITLTYVNVSGELVEYFMSQCPLLENLSVAYSEKLVNMRVVGDLLSLKNLHVSNCEELERVEICAVNLVSFRYLGRKIELHIHNVPNLVDLTIGGRFHELVEYAVFPLSGYLAQLRILTLGMSILEEDLEFPQLPELTNLRQLKLRVLAPDGKCLLGLTTLVEASPFLERFTLKFVGSGQWGGSWRQRTVKKSMNYPNKNLKVVEIVGFVGRANDMELVTYLLESASMLEKMVIKLSYPYIFGASSECMEAEKKQMARKCSLKLEPKLPPGAKLVIC